MPRRVTIYRLLTIYARVRKVKPTFYLTISVMNMSQTSELLQSTQLHAVSYLNSVMNNERAIAPSETALVALSASLSRELQEEAVDPQIVIDELVHLGGPAAHGCIGERLECVCHFLFIWVRQAADTSALSQVPTVAPMLLFHDRPTTMRVTLTSKAGPTQSPWQLTGSSRLSIKTPGATSHNPNPDSNLISNIKPTLTLTLTLRSPRPWPRSTKALWFP